MGYDRYKSVNRLDLVRGEDGVLRTAHHRRARPQLGALEEKRAPRFRGR
jgi:hypothetical protein